MMVPIFRKMLSKTSVCRFKSLSYYRHLAASPSFGRADSWGVAFRRRQLSALQTMEIPLDGDKYDWPLNLQTLVLQRKSFYLLQFPFLYCFDFCNKCEYAQTMFIDCWCVMRIYYNWQISCHQVMFRLPNVHVACLDILNTQSYVTVQKSEGSTYI